MNSAGVPHLDTDPWGSSAIPARCGSVRLGIRTSQKNPEAGVENGFKRSEDYLVSTRMVKGGQ